MIASLLLVIIFGGLMGSAMHVVWGLLTPLAALVVYGPKTARRYFAAYVGVDLTSRELCRGANPSSARFP